jgi:hypothetical protein
MAADQSASAWYRKDKGVVTESSELKTAGPGHAMIQRLLTAFATKHTMEPAEQRDLVSSNEAKVALLIAAAAVDANYQDGHLDDFSTETVMRGLTVAWERISPLSEDVTGGDGTVAESMREYLAAMRETRSQFGL